MRFHPIVVVQPVSVESMRETHSLKAGDSNVCAPASLLMGSSYYTRPDLFDETAALSSDQTNTSIGMFPWSAGGFGNGDTTAPINCGQRESSPDHVCFDASLTGELGYSESLNYTSETFECQLSFTYILLRVDSGSWITQTCFYCGGRLRTAYILFYPLNF